MDKTYTIPQLEFIGFHICMKILHGTINGKLKVHILELEAKQDLIKLRNILKRYLNEKASQDNINDMFDLLKKYHNRLWI